MTTPSAAADAVTPDLPLTLRDRAPRVVVVGDVMLDRWWVGSSRRLSREAPAPVVEVSGRHEAPGGAANTAMNLAALGADVRLVGLVGADEAGRALRALLERAGVEVSGLLDPPDVATVTKTRVVSDDQMLVRIDDVPPLVLTPALEEELATATAKALVEAEALLVCDYDSGVLLSAVQSAVGRQARPPLVVVDAHDPAPWAALRPDVVTPNAEEAFRLLGRAVPHDGTRMAALTAAAAELRTRSGAASVLVTLDRDGSMLLTGDADGRPFRTPGSPRAEKQAAGAGDTFVAALTLARAAGTSLEVAARLAQAAADVVVQRFGTSVCSTDELVEHLGVGDAALDEETLLRRVAADRAAGRRIVLTNGCFDVLHRGHTTYLQQAAQLGDVLVVAVNSDRSVRRLKGPERPINGEADRAGVIAALSCVAHVTVFDTDTPVPLLERLRPDVYAKGGDYRPEQLVEAAVVESYGGEVRILDFVPSQSTTDVVGRILARRGQPLPD
ncbi:rfaE bifunctional protein, domain I/rfaE bifunctional protein, domain II [Friedmanniella luteola]|uniref:Bifunctional protein HldE n=1 Tax=Friedmanniella luteola TaxID=546871 RepID=A0A1H1Y5S1_9ACTN|nr:D-glycero-beta-D-manno-heptose 1-phosphate adenylyltransferase [Friedmanniella luteola]SDT16376.1 rfaE bifunctional protein, domain I/rfaE bifunctional protein, domain II [Friedmanniella luteola]